MDIRVIEREDMKVIGIPWNGSYSKIYEIPLLFNKMKIRSSEVKNNLNQNIFIAPYHGRETELTYYVTVPVEEINNVPEGMVGFTIPRKNYVFCPHYGTVREIEDTYHRIEAWMDEYGYEHDHQALSLEIYQTNIEEKHFFELPIEFEIYVPVKKYTKMFFR